MRQDMSYPKKASRAGLVARREVILLKHPGALHLEEKACETWGFRKIREWMRGECTAACQPHSDSLLLRQPCNSGALDRIGPLTSAAQMLHLKRTN